jgi:hypothetical protein
MTETLIPNALATRILLTKLAFADKMRLDIDKLSMEMRSATTDLLPACPIVPTDDGVAGRETLTATRLSMTIDAASWTTSRFVNSGRGPGAIGLRVSGTVNGKSFENMSVEAANGPTYTNGKITGRKIVCSVRYAPAALSDAATRKVCETLAAAMVDAGITPERLDEIGTLLVTIGKVADFINEMKTYNKPTVALAAVEALSTIDEIR